MGLYLLLALVLLSIWLILFYHRPDLRTKMIITSLVILPLGIFDYLSQPNNWNPPTLFNLPIGINGIIFGFSIGGIGAVLYDEISQKHLVGQRKRKLTYWFVPIIMLVIGLSGPIFQINIMASLLLAMLIGLVLITLLRRDLLVAEIFSGIYFGVFYFLLMTIFSNFFPEVRGWWNLEVFNGMSLANVAIGEVLFGFLYGALWGVLYEFLFGYRLAGRN